MNNLKSHNSLKYDSCRMKDQIYASTAPYNYVMDSTRFVNCGNCTTDSKSCGTNKSMMGKTSSDLAKRLELENELFRYDLKNCGCSVAPMPKSNPHSLPKDICNVHSRKKLLHFS